MKELDESDIVAICIVLEQAIDAHICEINGVEDDLRWTESTQGRTHLEYVREMHEDEAAKLRILLEKLGHPYDGW